MNNFNPFSVSRKKKRAENKSHSTDIRIRKEKFREIILRAAHHSVYMH